MMARSDFEDGGGNFSDIFGETDAGVRAPVLVDADGVVQTALSPGAAALSSVAHTQVDVQGDSVVVAANADRVWLLIINDSDTAIYLNLGGAGVANTGIRVNATGGSWESSVALGNLYRGAINANHGGGAVNKSLVITEGE